MNAERVVLAPRARIAALIVALLCAAGALRVAQEETLAAPPWIESWAAEHPDPRAFTEAEASALRDLQGIARRADVLCLLGALAAGCALLAAWPALAARVGGARVVVLAGGSVALGVALAGVSTGEQARLARDGGWTLGDDALGAVAGPHAATLRAWRERVPESDAVLLLGTDSYLWNLSAWVLHPRAIYPVLRDVPAELTDDALVRQLQVLELGRGHGARWAIDLGALAAPESCAHAALLKVDP